MEGHIFFPFSTFAYSDNTFYLFWSSISFVSFHALLSLYLSSSKVNMSNFDLVMESDLGTFAPMALQFTGSDAARKVGLKTQCHHTILSFILSSKHGVEARVLQSIDSGISILCSIHSLFHIVLFHIVLLLPKLAILN